MLLLSDSAQRGDTDVQAPHLLLLFGDALVGMTGKDDDDDEELSPHLLEYDEEKEDAILLPNASRPPSSQSGEPPSSPAVELDCAVAKLSIDRPSQQFG